MTKHGAVAFAEWLAVTYGDRGIGVSAVCPLGVATPLLLDPLEQGSSAAAVVAASRGAQADAQDRQLIAATRPATRSATAAGRVAAGLCPHAHSTERAARRAIARWRSGCTTWSCAHTA